MLSQIHISRLVRAFTNKPISHKQKEKKGEVAVMKLSKFQEPVKQTSNAITFGILIIILAMAGCSTWMSVAPLEGAIIGVGEVTNLDRRTTIQHQEGGIVSEVLVREGDAVRSGTPLVELIDKSLDADLAMVNSDLDKILIRKARYEAERDLRETLDLPAALDITNPQVTNIVRTEEQGFSSSRKLYEAQQQLVVAQQSDLTAESTGLKREVTQLEKAYSLLEAEITNAESLVQQNYLSRNALLSLQRESADYLAQLESKRTRINRARKQIASLNLQKQEIRAAYIDRANQQLSELKNDERIVREKLSPLEDAVRRQIVTASISGRILAMESLHPGSVLPAGGRILDIVPDEDELVVNARISVADIDEVYPGQNADIRFSAFPARRTPVVLGNVKTVSADRLIDQNTGQSYFSTEIRVKRDSLEASQLPPLRPGMKATVFLKTQKRTALDYLLSPIITFNEKAMRES